MSTGSLPAHVNYRKLAQENHRLEGIIPLPQFERLVEILEFEAADVQARAEFRKVNKQRVLIVGKAIVTVSSICQSCLSPMDMILTAELRHLVVEDLNTLQALAEDEDGLICSGEMIKLVDIFEDELILGIPMICRHQDGQCETTLEHENDNSEIQPDTYKPFAALADLKNE